MGMGQIKMGLNMMGQENMGHNMIGQDNMGRNMMGRNIYMANSGMPSDMSGMMGKQMMDSNMMGQQDMTVNMMGQDRPSQMRRSNMMGHQDMTPNMTYLNMRGQDMMDMANNQMASSMVRSNSNNGVMGQRMMQQMEMESTPETYTSTRFF